LNRAGAFALLCCLLAAAFAAPAGAQEGLPDPEAARAPTSAVYGRAVYEDTGRPVRRARVFLFRPDARGPELTALTGTRGEFRIEGVPAGRFFAAVDGGGAVSPLSFFSVEELRGGGPDMESVAEMVDVVEVDGKADKELTVRVRRGAAISGRVTYSDGEPASNATIHLMRRSGGRFVKFLVGLSPGSMISLRTDDRGVYRVAGLPAGEYVVAVSETADHSGNDRPENFLGDGLLQSLFGQQLLVTFHPSAAREKDATVLRLAAGGEYDGVDITVAERETHVLAGVVRDRRGGLPLAGARVSIRRRGEGDGGTPGEGGLLGDDQRFVVSTDAEGRWKFRELPEGAYSLDVTPPHAREATDANMNMNMNVTTTTTADAETGVDTTSLRPRSPARRLAPARRELTLTGDVADYLIELGEGARISGTAQAEGGELPPHVSVWVTQSADLFDSPESFYGVSPQGFVREGRFEIQGLAPGRYFLRTDATGSGGDVYLKSIIWNGRDLLREPLEVAEGARVAGVRLVFARGVGRVEVKVSAPGGGPHGPSANLFVYLVEAGALREGGVAARPPASCPVGPSGSCVVTAAPGEYVVVAAHGPQGMRDLGAEALRRAAAPARVSLVAGEAKSIEVAAPARK